MLKVLKGGHKGGAQSDLQTDVVLKQQKVLPSLFIPLIGHNLGSFPV